MIASMVHSRQELTTLYTITYMYLHITDDAICLMSVVMVIMGFYAAHFNLNNIQFVE